MKLLQDCTSEIIKSIEKTQKRIDQLELTIIDKRSNEVGNFKQEKSLVNH